MPHHWQKLRVEERLLESGLPFTILQPAPYMQNVLAHRRRILEDGIYPVPYSAKTRLALVDLVDVGETVATVLLETGHKDAVYELTGEAGMTQTEVAAVLGHAAGRTVMVEETAVEDWRRQAIAGGIIITFDVIGPVSGSASQPCKCSQPATRFAACMARPSPRKLPATSSSALAFQARAFTRRSTTCVQVACSCIQSRCWSSMKPRCLARGCSMS